MHRTHPKKTVMKIENCRKFELNITGQNRKTSVTYFRYVSRFLDNEISWSVLILGLVEFIDLWKHNHYSIYSNRCNTKCFLRDTPGRPGTARQPRQD